MACPNINSPEWKALVDKIGVFEAFKEFVKNKEEIPDASKYGESFKGVNTTLKVVGALQQLKRSAYPSNSVQGFYNDLIKLGAPKNQLDLLREHIASQGITNIDVPSLVVSLLSEMSYTVEIKTATEGTNYYTEERVNGRTGETYYPIVEQKTNKEITRFTTEAAAAKYLNETYYDNTQHYSTLTAPGGVNYTENEIATPNITPVRKGHAKFATANGIGWFRSDDRGMSFKGVPNVGAGRDSVRQDGDQWVVSNDEIGVIERFDNPKDAYEFIGVGYKDYSKEVKTRRILEVQSDLFQKEKDSKDLTGTIINTEEIMDWEMDGQPPVYRIEEAGDSYLLWVRRGSDPSDIYGDYDTRESAEATKLRLEEQDKLEAKPKPERIIENSDPVGNKFLQLLNKDSNWVSFFIKSILQDSSRKGYKKALFPTKETLVIIESAGRLTWEGIASSKDTPYALKAKEMVKWQMANARRTYLEVVASKSWIPYSDEGPSTIIIANQDYKGSKGFYAWDGQNYFHRDNKSKKDTIVSDEEMISVLKTVKQAGGAASSYGERRIEVDQHLKATYLNPSAGGQYKNLINTALFYENTVANTLRKQGFNPVKITDEHGNTWNEVEVTEKTKETIMFSKQSETQSSKASPKTIARVKEFLTRIGVNVEQLSTEYKGINAVAKLLEATIDIAEGKEDVALPEEAMHFAVELLKTHNPKLYKSMLNKVGNYQIYQSVLSEYGSDANYLNKDGSKNIIKLKEEAMGKILAEYYIKREEGSTEKPELLSQSRNWLESLKEWIKSLIIKAKFNPFQEAIDAINTQNIGKAKDIAEEIAYRIDTSFIKGAYKSIIENGLKNGDYSFLKDLKEQLQDPNSYTPTLRMLGGDVQLAHDVMSADFQSKNKFVDEAYDKFIEEDAKMVLLNQGTDDRHYTYDGTRVVNTVTTKIDDKKKFAERTEEEKFEDLEKARWGTEGHDFAKAYFKTLIDENGYALSVPTPSNIKSNLSPALQIKLKSYFLDLIKSYPEGTRFAVETQVINKKEKGMLASAMDFLAFVPDTKLGVVVDILDWKFFSMNKEKNKDIPWYKSDKWKKQMGEYITIAKLYGIKANQLRKTRMVPFIANYGPKNKSNRKEGLVLNSLEIGDVNTAKETKTYLLPVASNDESTGNQRVDSLLSKLRAQYEKLYKKPVGEMEKGDKFAMLEEISTAIRKLHLQMDFIPLSKEAEMFGGNLRKTLDKFVGIDFNTMSSEQLRLHLASLAELDDSANNYIGIDATYLSAYPREGMTVEQRKILNHFEIVSQRIARLKEEIKVIQAKAASSIAIRERVMKGTKIDQGSLRNLTEEEAIEKILSPEKEIGLIARTFLEASKLPQKIIQLSANLIMNRKSLQYQEEKKLVNRFSELLTPFLATTSHLKNPLDAIRDKSAAGLRMIRRVDPEFYKEAKKAKEARNKQFFIDNMDMVKYNELVAERIKTSTENIMNTTYDNSDPEANLDRQESEIIKLKNSLDITSDKFSGLYNYTFDYFFRQAFLSEKHISKEYTEMAKDPAVLAVWNFYTELNERGRKSGYLDKQGLSFLPMIQGTIVERMAASENIFAEASKLMKENYILNIEEHSGQAKINKETGEVEKSIPKLFTTTDKEINELSMDVTKITAPWIKALLSFEASQDLEHILYTLHEVEQSKGHLQINPTSQEVIFENSAPKSFYGNEKNASLLEKMINDAVYGINEDGSSMLDVAYGKALDKVGGTEEQKQMRKFQGKKLMRNANAWTQVLATGAKLMVSIPNFVGNNMQAIINSGTFFSWSEYQKNLLGLAGSLSSSDPIVKGLLDLIHPLNEDVTGDNTRKLAGKQSTLKYLSTWSINDIMHSMNRFGELAHEYTNAITFNENSMVVEGRIIPIRQFLMKEDQHKYGLSQEERKNLEKTFEDRVKALKESSSLVKTAKFNAEGLLEIAGVSPEELAKYRTLVVEHARTTSGSMSRDNKADYTRSTILRSFMMFKNWIPKQVSLRTLDVHHNNETDSWEYGRTRLFIKTWAHLGLTGIASMTDIIAGNDKGLAIMREILEEKREAFYKATGQELEITEEEFFDMMRKELHSQSKELILLLSVMSMYLGSKLAVPDDDDPLAANRLKWWQKLISKITDELAFYYSPTSADSITRGSITPSLSILNKIKKAIFAISAEAYGGATDNQEIMDDQHPTKYILNLIPGAAQFQNEILPILDPEAAKEMGIRFTAQPRQGN